MILSALYTLIISPLELLFEVIYTVANRLIGNAGLSIIFLSLAVNFLVLPLYKRADELQTEERDIQNEMAFMVKHIKRTFSGDERFLMLQEYYRINNYKPIYALKSSVSLLLQIPFFIAAYNLLSGMQSLQGMQFGFISDLGKEDAMFTIGSFPVNILPILMTLINIVSGIIYTKGHPLKAKIQVYGLAAVFLVLLYRSPSGLVFYWLLNNVFSLVKNIFYKLKNPRKVLNIVLAIAGGVIIVLSLIRTDLDARQKILLSAGCVLLALPLISGLIKKKTKPVTKTEPAKADHSFFFAGAFFMALFTGFLIPVTIIKSSTQEFIDVLYPSNPYIYIINSILLSFGTWVLWAGVFYFFMSGKTRSLFSNAIWMICGVSIADYMLFGTNLGNLSSTLQFDNQPSFAFQEYLLNTLVVAAVALVATFAYIKFRKIARGMMIVGILTTLSIGAFQSKDILHTYKQYMESFRPSAETPQIPLSKNGKNVVVVMLDRTMSLHLPYIFQEKPEIKEQFDGFTYYTNTISYGPYTNLATPALYGGYEYTPERLNARSEESLESKQNEALKVMPVIFGENGYEVTIFDPTYAGYEFIPDLSVFDDHPEFNCYITNAKFSILDNDEEQSDMALSMHNRVDDIRNRNFFCFSLMKTAPLILQETIYDGGIYNEAIFTSSNEKEAAVSSYVQHTEGLSKSTGYNKFFLEAYPVLCNLPEMTTISDDSKNTFLMMSNDTVHSPCLLQEPDYVPAMYVDNTEYDVDNESRYTLDGKTLPMATPEQVTYYHSYMAAFIQFGKWFDYLRENGVYDNTRIIIVSDHGFNTEQFSIMCNNLDVQFFMPILLVKDFDKSGFTISDEFMTNSDTPALATANLIDDPTNPFTGNPIDSQMKAGPQTVFFSRDLNLYVNNGNTFLPGDWYSVEGDPHDPDSWTYLGNW
ncbi:YidC/Oxa1 family membrane protein insertase [Butyrivibrio sp. AE2032]|uniref:YidC/Oxa1 family membrane protein insertase n=1 Tax=Butyrivibrio sp. AE2032 TaxID=1458463 RepID=UPI00054D81DF|nr:YidC/Oxa1 family membrane protein insertase [Butyrivibrio sp. AE2032]